MFRNLIHLDHLDVVLLSLFTILTHQEMFFNPNYFEGSAFFFKKVSEKDFLRFQESTCLGVCSHHQRIDEE